MRIGEQEHVQQATAAAREEIAQLKEMTFALREELERRRIEYGEQRQALEQAGREEARQLQEMIRTLREKLEIHEKR